MSVYQSSHSYSWDFMSRLLIYDKCIKILKHPANISVHYPICTNRDSEFFSTSTAQATLIMRNVMKRALCSYQEVVCFTNYTCNALASILQQQQAAAAVPATSLTPDEWSPSAAVSLCNNAMQGPTAVLPHLQLPTPTPMSLCTSQRRNGAARYGGCQGQELRM